jgi:hypothetical protein
MFAPSIPEYFPFDADRPVPVWYVCLVRAGFQTGMDAWEIRQIAEAGMQSSIGQADGREGIDRMAKALRSMGKTRLASAFSVFSRQMLERGDNDSFLDPFDMVVSGSLVIELEEWVSSLHEKAIDLFGLHNLSSLVGAAFQRYALFLQAAGEHPVQCRAIWKLISLPGARIPVSVTGVDFDSIRGKDRRSRSQQRRQAALNFENELSGWLKMLTRRYAAEYLGEEYSSAFVPILVGEVDVSQFAAVWSEPVNA